jgi:glycosyltransferase involved in cell wall biosynthesis
LDTNYWCEAGLSGAADKRIQLGIGVDIRVVGTAANLIERKAVNNLIEAVAALPSDLSNTVLVIAGDGPQRARLEMMSRDLEISERVFFVGQQSDMRPWYSLFDVFVLTSLEEAFGLVYAEALLAGTPVIGSDVGGVPEIIEEGVTGLLVPPQAPRCLTSAIEILLRHPAEGQRMASAGREKAIRLFSLERMVSDYETLYGQVSLSYE